MTGNRKCDECALCDAGQLSESSCVLSGTTALVAYHDDELIALLQPGVPGMLLAPRAHIASLSTLPQFSAVFLAALRCAVSQVQTTYGTSHTLIEPKNSIPGAVGHICYHVVPTPSRESSQAEPLDLVAEARRVAEALRRWSTSRRGRPVVPI